MNSEGRNSRLTAASQAKHHPDDRWQACMHKGKIAYMQGNCNEALRYYLSGLEEAERLLWQAPSAEELHNEPAAALVVAASNASGIFLESERYTEAQNTMRRACYLLCKTTGEDGISPIVRAHCVQHLERALILYTDSLVAGGADKETVARETGFIQPSIDNFLNISINSSFH